MSSPALSVRNLRIKYGDHVAVDSVDLDVFPGEIFGLLGPNGSGKSSILAAVAGCVGSTSRTITLAGETRQLDPTAFASRLGYVAQEPALYDELSVRDNLRFFGSLYDLPESILKYRVQRCLERVGLEGRSKSAVGSLSGGLKRRAHVAAALLHDPKVLLLDEPTAALDADSRDRLLALLGDLRDEGRAVVLTTHLLDEAEQWCDRVAVVRFGKLIAEGKPAELARPKLDRCLMYGHLHDHLPAGVEVMLRERMPEGVRLELTGRRVRLASPDNDRLAAALTVLLSEGVSLDSFRTPPGGLERLMSNAPVMRGVSCDVRSA